MQDGTAAPLIDIAQPVREDDRPASRHRAIAAKGVGSAVTAAVCYVTLAALHAGFHNQVRPEVWTWSRTTLITVIVVGLVLAAYGYGVEASDRRAELVAERVVASVSTALARALDAIEESRKDMHADHAALHRENVQLREMLGPLLEAAGRLQAYEEQRAFEVTALRREVRSIHELLAVMRQESPPAVIAQQVSELHDRQDETEHVLADVAAKVGVAYTTGFTDALGGADGPQE